MAKQNMYPSTYIKNMDVYQNFSDGLNTRQANETLSEKELPYMTNVDIIERGTLQRRNGMKLITDYTYTEQGAAGQGFFRYFYADGTTKDIVAKNGYLFLNGVKQTITGFTGQLQTTREMNGVQYKDKMYIATGTKLVVFDGTTFSTITPYKPSPLEALYVGLNGLATDPEDFISNGVSTVSSIQGVKMQEQYIDSNNNVQTRHAKYGTVNKPIIVTAYYSKPSTDTLEFQFSWRKDTDKEGTWALYTDWSTTDHITFTTGYAGVIQLKIGIRKKGTTLLIQEYVVPQYLVKPTKAASDEGYYAPTLETSNQIFVYWERLYLYGDPSEPDMLFASDVSNFNYFPISNTLRFENDRKEGISTIRRFKDFLVVFTDSTTQALEGKSPTEWQRTMLNPGIGCIAPKSVQSVMNTLIFLAKDGIYQMKSVYISSMNFNFTRIDTGVQDKTAIMDRNASSAVFQLQYQIVYPSQKTRMRYYYNMGAWTMDTSSHLDLTTMLAYDGLLFAQKANGAIVQFDPTYYNDLAEVYPCQIELKAFSFQEPYHIKKLKEVRVMIGDQPRDTNCLVEVFVDDTQAFSGNVAVQATNKLTNDPKEELTNIYKLRVTGKGHYVKSRITQTEDRPFIFVGLGFIYKVKKP